MNRLHLEMATAEGGQVSHKRHLMLQLCWLRQCASYSRVHHCVGLVWYAWYAKKECWRQGY
jgi:energy-converting hydrogenase A subunit M